MNENRIYVMAQGFYGNRTETEVRKENIDRFILGYMDSSIEIDHEEIDRTIIRIPNTDNLVIIYNKYAEERKANDNYKVLVNIPESNINLHSRCIVCRMNSNGEFESLHDEDYEKFIDYLAK